MLLMSPNDAIVLSVAGLAGLAFLLLFSSHFPLLERKGFQKIILSRLQNRVLTLSALTSLQPTLQIVLPVHVDLRLGCHSHFYHVAVVWHSHAVPQCYVGHH